jgi:hypothetical protein
MHFSFVFYIPYISLPYVAPCLKQKSSVEFAGFFVTAFAIICVLPRQTWASGGTSPTQGNQQNSSSILVFFSVACAVCYSVLVYN